jgi:transcription antitermination factor NusG
MNAISSNMVAVSTCADAGVCAIDSPASASHAENQAEFSSSKISSRNWGGPRANSGGPRANSGGPRANSGGARPNSGPKPRAIQTFPLGPRWHVIQIAPGCEHRVARDLLEGESRRGFPPRQSFLVEMPLTVDDRMRSGKVVRERVFMFPGYGLIHFDAANDPWPQIRDCDGVVQLFTNRSNRPLPLPDGFVEALITSASERLSLAAKAGTPREIGALLWVDHGPFIRLPAVCVECNGLTTKAEAMFFGRMMPLQLPYDAFSPRVS